MTQQNVFEITISREDLNFLNTRGVYFEDYLKLVNIHNPEFNINNQILAFDRNLREQGMPLDIRESEVQQLYGNKSRNSRRIPFLKLTYVYNNTQISALEEIIRETNPQLVITKYDEGKYLVIPDLVGSSSLSPVSPDLVPHKKPDSNYFKPLELVYATNR